MSIPPKIKEIYETATCLYTKNQVEAALDSMALNIKAVLQDQNPVVLCVLVGGIIPTGCVLPRLDFPLEVDYIHATRYQRGTTGGEISWRCEPTINLNGRVVLIVDDILDKGDTLRALVDYCREKQAEAVYTAVLVDKKVSRSAQGIQQADFVGVVAEDRWLFGYGLDFKEYLRNAPGIYAVAPKHTE